MDHLIQKCPFKTPNALYQIYRMPHSMTATVSLLLREKSQAALNAAKRTAGGRGGGIAR